jgi:hypothetical protein
MRDELPLCFGAFGAALVALPFVVLRFVDVRAFWLILDGAVVSAVLGQVIADHDERVGRGAAARLMLCAPFAGAIAGAVAALIYAETRAQVLDQLAGGILTGAAIGLVGAPFLVAILWRTRRVLRSGG